MKSFPVFHGGTYVSLGFSFGREGEFVYISDVKIVPDTTMEYLRSIPKIKVLVIDALDREGIYSHVGLEESIEICETLKPEVVYFTGMACGMGLHDEVEAELAERFAGSGTKYCLAFDGMVLDGLKL